jgi:hypothetical protein
LFNMICEHDLYVIVHLAGPHTTATWAVERRESPRTANPHEPTP